MARRTSHASAHLGPDLGRVLACVVLFVLSLVGTAAIGLPFAFRLPSVRARIDRWVVGTVKSETGLDVQLQIERPLWPPGVLVRDVRVASTDPARPFATVREARVTLRPFALLSGEVVIDGVELDGLSVDAEMKEGVTLPTNLPLTLKVASGDKTEALDPPFRQLSLTGAHVKVKWSRLDPAAEPYVADVTQLDLDVDASAEGATKIYNIRMDRAAGSLRTPRLQLAPPPYDRFLHKKVVAFAQHKVWDEDALCGLTVHAQVSDAPGGATFALQRFELDAHLDGDEALGTAPSCIETEVADPQVFHVRLLHADAEVPKQGEPHLRIGPAAKLHVQAPAMLAARYMKLPAVGGWVTLDLDVGADLDLREPIQGLLKASATGRIEAHEVRLEQYRFGESIIGDISIKQPLTVSSNKLDVKYGDGLVSITDLEIRAAPNPVAKKQIPLKATVGIKGVTFPGLIRELGVTKAAHVGWDLDEGTAHLSGFLDPLQLDGDLVAKTKDFEVGLHEIEGWNVGHVVGIKSPIDLSTRFAIRDKYFQFDNVRARWGTSSLAARVYLGFDERLEVDATSDQLDLSEVSPLVRFPIDGTAKLDYKVRGTFADPQGDGTATIGGFSFDGFDLGDVETTNAKFRGQVVEISGYHAHKGNSPYEVTSMRVDLGEKGGPILVDGLADSGNFDLDDFYHVFHLEEDPRWKDVMGHVAFGARTRLVVGGPDDPCGTGHLSIDLDAKVLAMDLWGERYDGGSMETSIEWYDFGAGGLGMDLDLQAATLHKKGGGDVVLSGKILRGGKLDLHANVGGISLRHLASMPETTIPLDGTIDAVADIGGTFADMTVDADVSLSPIRIADRMLGRSHLHVVRRPLPALAPSPAPDGRGCYTGRRLPLFDPGQWAQDAAEGEYAIAGTLFDGEVTLDDVRVTDQRHKVASGKIAVRGLDVGPLALLRPRNDLADLSDKYEAPPAPLDIEGKASADVSLDKMPFDEWWNGAGSIANLTLDLETDTMGVATAGATPTITFGPDGARLPETSLTMTFGDSQTKVTLAADIDRTQVDPVTGSPTLSARLELPMLPLSRLEQFFPKLERAEGTLRGTLSVDGTIAAPTWSGEVVVENGAFSVRGFTMPVSNVDGRIDVDPKAGIRIAKLHGEVGGGTIDVSGGAKLHGFALGDVDVRVAAKDVHMKYGDGIQLTLGGELRATWSPPELGATSDPMNVAGFVDVDSFLYERPVKVFDVNSLQTAQRTDVEAYDPARDFATFDVELRSKSGFHLRNNLVDATVLIGQPGLRAVGSNQRWGMVGEVYVVTGGIFRFRNHDFEIREGTLKFTDETKIDPNIDVVAQTDYRRAAGAGSSAAAEWRIKLHAYGSSSDLKLELTSDPPLSQEDAILLLTIGMTRAEANALGGGGVAGGAGLDFLANLAGVDQTVKQAIPVIDDFRFGTAYSVKTGRTEPQITLGKRLTNSVRASVTSGFGEQREVLSNIEWQLSQKMSLQGSYDNINDITSSSVGNVGVDLRYRLEFE